MAILGNMISVGGGGSSSSVINVPITISLSEPVPERVGHLWVVSDKEASITKIEFNEKINSSAANGTLQLIVPLTVQHLDISQYMKIGTRKIIGTLESGNTISKWIIGNAEKNDEYCKLYVDSYPLVYTNIGGVRYIENAYVWSGTEWFMCCQKDSYLYAPYGSSAGIYNIINYTSTVAKTIAANTNYKLMSTMSPKGNYIFDTVNKKILKKVGDEYQNWLSSPVSYACAYATFSPNDNYVAITKSTTLAALYSISSSGLTYLQDIRCDNADSIPAIQRIAFSQDGSVILTLTKTTVSSSDKTMVYAYKLNNTTGKYDNTSTFTSSNGYSSNATSILSLTNNAFVIHFQSKHQVDKLTVDNSGIISSTAQTIFAGSASGSYNLSNYVHTTKDGKWVFLGSYSTNLSMDYTSYTAYDRRGNMIVVNTQTSGKQAQAIYDGTMSVRGVFETTDGQIKVLCFIDGHGFFVVTWKDTGANTLTYVGQQKILDYANVSSSYSSACPVVSQ